MTAKSDDVIELDRQLKLSEAVLRTKVLRADEAVFRINPVEVPAATPAEKAEGKAAPKTASKVSADKKPAAKRPAAKTAK